MAVCPSHRDSKASLHITVHGEDDFVIHCFAGCTWTEIVAAATELDNGVGGVPRHNSTPSAAQVDSGIESSPIIPLLDGKSGLEMWSEYTQVPEEFWESLGVISKGQRIAFTWEGYSFQKCRGVYGKEFEWIGHKPSLPTIWPTPIAEGGMVYLTEGESDCGIMRYLGFPAHTFGGTQNAKGEELGEMLKAWGVSEVCIVFDSDKAGRKGSREMREAIIDSGLRCRNLDITTLLDKRAFETDIRDIYKRVGSELARLLQELYERTSDAIVSVPSSTVTNESTDVDWICEPYLARGSLTLLCGVAKGGKTTWTFSLMRELRESLTGGLARNFLGSAVVPGSVLYLSEDGRKAWNIRRAAHMRVGEDNHIHVFFAGIREAGSSWQDVVTTVEREATSKSVSLIVVDTVPVWANIDDENNATQVNRALEPLRRLAESNDVAILAIHYFNKGGGFRGSTSFEAIPDILIDIETHDNRDTRTIKVRGKMSPIDPKDITYTMVYDDDDDNPARLEIVEGDSASGSGGSDNPDTIMEVFDDENVPLTILEICQRLGFHDVIPNDNVFHKVRRQVKKMVIDGILLENHKARPHTFTRFISVKPVKRS